ncbi:MAG: class I SAM-dependent methyltransferase [Caldilinea sp.]|nr:class I SAM-dependent methyltransferase [Caldilinea sp.]MDW8439432.1 class I SAM-dependent methyltransferase [Caldilineaceae bacterium]
MNAKTYWEQLYARKAPTQVSWYQEHAQLSLVLIRRAGVQKSDPIIDVGGGTSTLVDDLLAAGFQQITVLDIAAKALELARERLGERAAQVTWIEADVTQTTLPARAYALWHDRAVFHFLTQPADRRRYIENARRAVRSGGSLILATFAQDGPERCSGLEVMRYSAERLQQEFCIDFEPVESLPERHRTPFGTEQKFLYCLFRRR